MALIFNALNGYDNRGRVAVLPQFGAAPGAMMQVDGWGGFQGFKSIFTRISIAQQTNHQIQHMLGDRLYLNVFGDRIGMMELSGLSFFNNCNDDFRTGFFYVQEFYRQNKLTRRATPLRITTDPFTVYEGFLLAMRGEAISMAQTDQRIYQFSMALAIIPEDASRQG